MKIIKRFIITPSIDNTCKVKLAKNAEFLSVLSNMDKDVSLFALVDRNEKDIKECKVYFFETGKSFVDVPDSAFYVGSVNLHRDCFTFHIYVENL